MASYMTIKQVTLIIYQSPESILYVKNESFEHEKAIEFDKMIDSIPTTVHPEVVPTTQLISANQKTKRKYPKDDYQKNITINVVKCCIRSMLSKAYERKIKRECQKSQLNYEQLHGMVQPILKEVVISLGDLKKMLTSGSEQQFKMKRFFLKFLIWYLRKKYMYYLLVQGKMSFKQRYIEYKNKFMINLLMMIKDQMGEPDSIGSEMDI